MKKIILTLSFLLVGCDKEVERKPYIDKVNQDFVNEANVLFDGKAGDLKGYSSYSSNTVSYKIKADEFEINNFLNKKDKQLKKWDGNIIKNIMKVIYFVGIRVNLKLLHR